MPFSKNLELNMFQLHYMVRSIANLKVSFIPSLQTFSCVLLLLVGITLLPFHDLLSIISNGQELPVKVIDTHKVL